MSDFVRDAWLFSTLDEAQLAKIRGLLRQRKYAKGSVIFYQGDIGDCMYFIADGSVRIYVSNEDAHEATIRLYGRGASFGELAILDGGPRTASAVAHADLTALLLFREELVSLMRGSFDLTMRLVQMLVERLRYTTRYSGQLIFLDAPVRVASLLAHMATIEPKGIDNIQIDATQDELATYLNITREWVNRALRQLSDLGLIRVERGHVLITHLSHIKAYVERVDMV